MAAVFDFPGLNVGCQPGQQFGRLVQVVRYREALNGEALFDHGNPVRARVGLGAGVFGGHTADHDPAMNIHAFEHQVLNRPAGILEIDIDTFGRQFLKLGGQVIGLVVDGPVEAQLCLSISSMVGFGETVLLPLMDEFVERYPEITLDIRLSDELSMLGRDEVDIAVRGGYAPKDRVVAVKLMDNYFVPAASPDYLAAMGTPSHPRDLARHRGLFFRTPGYLPPGFVHLPAVPETALPDAQNQGDGRFSDRANQEAGIVLT